MYTTDLWEDFEVLDLANGQKLERWGDYTFIRPDPQVIWDKREKPDLWKNVHGKYIRSNKGGGNWDFYKKIPECWTISYRDLKFNLKPMSFKHTGLFPEQATNWDWMDSLIKKALRPVKVLNLFAYTGGATVACLAAGASVVHVDASKGMVSWAKDNVVSSNLQDKPVRFIVDDVMKFVLREQRRGNTYDAIIMDPPSYGRGPGGEVWKIEEQLFSLVNECAKLLSDNPLFFLINSYTTGLQPLVISNILKMSIKSVFGGHVEADEVGLKVSHSDLVLPCGASGRWSSIK